MSDAAVRTVATGVHQLKLASRTLPPFDHTWVTLVVRGGRGLLVDPGFSGPADAGRIAAFARDHGVRELAGVLITHTHPDHIAGLPALQAELGPLPVRVHPLEAQRLPDGSGPVTPMGDGRTLVLAGTTVRALHTPGHSPGHLVFVVNDPASELQRDAPAAGVLAGDLITGSGPPWIGLPEGDPAAYLASLDAVARLQPAWLALAHGELPQDPAAALQAASEHRRRREEQVLAAARDGATLVTLRERVYGEAIADFDAKATAYVDAALLALTAKLMNEMRLVHLGDGPNGPYRTRDGAA